MLKSVMIENNMSILNAHFKLKGILLLSLSAKVLMGSGFKSLRVCEIKGSNALISLVFKKSSK